MPPKGRKSMTRACLPEYVLSIIARLKGAGFASYAVGGCVRDIALGRTPADYDVATAALPENVAALFEKTVNTGEKHGTVTVFIGKNSVEVTTFRTEGGYSDHRRPDSVQFVSELEADLARRDFTINALAMDENGIIIDSFGGLSDMERRLIRCVGEPTRRFNEDALRMLRALRFSAVLGFDIEEETYNAIKACAPLARSLSAERVREELRKTLVSPRPETVGELIRLGLLSTFLTPKPLDLTPLTRCPNDENARIALFVFLLRREGLIASAGEFLRALRFSGETVSVCSKAAEIIARGLPKGAADMKRLIFSAGEGAVSCAAAAMGEEELFSRVLSSGECLSLKELAVSGGDLLALGLEGRAVGETLLLLLDHVFETPSDNERNILLNIAKKQSKNILTKRQ